MSVPELLMLQVNDPLVSKYGRELMCLSEYKNVTVIGETLSICSIDYKLVLRMSGTE